MTDATLTSFRALADAMAGPTPRDWQWIGPHLSQRMFGITAQRAQDYAERFGGHALPMDTPSCAVCGRARDGSVGHERCPMCDYNPNNPEGR